MANVLVVSELSEDGKLKKSTLSAITFARQALPAVGGNLIILVLGANTAEAAAELSGYGAAKIIAVDDPSLGKYTAEHYAPSVVAAAPDNAAVELVKEGVNGELIIIGALGLFGAAVFLLPFLDRNTNRSRRIIRWMCAVSLMAMIVLTVLAYVGGETAHP